MEKLNSGDIARLAGVSRATVSRVVNGADGVRPETRRRVLEVVQRHGYTPNWFGQALARSRSNTLALFMHLPCVFRLPDARDYRGRAESAHIGQMIEQVVLSARRNGFTVLVDIVPELGPADEAIRAMFRQSRIDAGLFIGFPDDAPLLAELAASRYVVGAFDYTPRPEAPSCVTVNLDGDLAGQAVRYLAGLGHRRILAVEGDPRRLSGRERASSFRAAMAALGLPDDLPHLQAGYDRNQAYRVTDAFLRSRPAKLPTAYCCANDSVAVGVLDALRVHGVAVPEQASVIGMDDTLLCQHVAPQLTTFALDYPAMLDTLTQRVIDCVCQPFSKAYTQAFPGTLVERGSCRRLA